MSKYIKIALIFFIYIYVFIGVISAPVLSAAYMQELCTKDSSYLPRYDVGHAGFVGTAAAMFWPLWADKLWYEFVGKYS